MFLREIKESFLGLVAVILMACKVFSAFGRHVILYLKPKTSHRRSRLYYTRSIANNKFISRTCTTTPQGECSEIALNQNSTYFRLFTLIPDTTSIPIEDRAIVGVQCD